jgi:hypothetical protein
VAAQARRAPAGGPDALAGHEGSGVEYDEAMRPYTGYIALAIFASLLAIGLSMDEFRTALANAIIICLSCIGIG